MSGRILLLLVVGVTMVFAESLQSDYIDELFRIERYSQRFSNDVKEDAKLDVPELIIKYKYPLEVHEVTTPDGYILQMHRIPHGRDKNNVPGTKRPVVFLMHGLLCSSADWIISGPGSAFGYILVEEGFDVWMGNARGNYYSRNHVELNPDNTDFWDFSWDEIGNIDLPIMIDYALAVTGNEKIHYVGHSQGSTAFLVLCSLRPEYNDKIISMHAFSPVAFMAHNESPVLNAIAPFANSIKILASLIGIGEILPNTLLLTWAGQIFCKDHAITQEICSNILFAVGGWNDAHLNTTMIPVIFGHTPAGSSVKQFAHYGQSIASKEFRRYDHGIVKNIRLYGRRSPPKYNLSNIVVPIFFYYSDNDPLSQSKDVYRLYEELGSESKVLLPLPSFGHLDYLWGIDVKPLLYDTVIQLMGVVEDQ
ncbi:lipase 1 [Papilio machaon]|uniref:lipase 1 n=1 Tax=Papilio machaon TaxID=76193 RepID=UPI001E665544|nr:lipase 1 [Papilio machaon]